MQDRARIYVCAGAGGDGCLSFRREAHVPRGGPDGGDGGRGGDVVLVCDDSLRDLERFRRAAHFKAARGGHGQGAQRHGAEGHTLEIRVPPGTEALLEATGTRLDLTRPGQRALIVRGGSGGRGNKHFAGPTHQTPRFAERGLAGEDTWVALALKLLADVGLVGLPNAGKSSLLARLTRAHPKIAAYPFTTLEPVLGTLDLSDRQLVIADIPGLIEGASAGAGLGHEFLAHVQRTALLVHVLECRPLDGSDPVVNYETVERELASYDRRLTSLPQILALSKSDLVTAEEATEARRGWEARLGPDVPVIVTSAVTGAGLDALGSELARRVAARQQAATGPHEAASPHEATGPHEATSPRAARGVVTEPPGGVPADDSLDLDALAEHRVFRPAAPRAYEVRRTASGGFRVTGAGIERLVARYDLDNDEALAYLERRLRGIGVIRALEAEGFQPGDEVEIAGIAFDLDPSV